MLLKDWQSEKVTFYEPYKQLEMNYSFTMMTIQHRLQ
jgi:hypothetical protein